MSDYDMKCPKCFMLYNWQRGHVCPMPPRADLPPRAETALRAVSERADVYWALFCELSPYARHREDCRAFNDWDDERPCTCGYNSMVAKVSERLMQRDKEGLGNDRGCHTESGGPRSSRPAVTTGEGEESQHSRDARAGSSTVLQAGHRSPAPLPPRAEWVKLLRVLAENEEVQSILYFAGWNDGADQLEDIAAHLEHEGEKP